MFVYIKTSALVGMLGPIIEEYTKEVGGILVGDVKKQWLYGKREDTITIENAYPVITAERTKNFWQIGNWAAFDRARQVIKSLGLNMIGGYHSHPNTSAELSAGDKEYIREEEDLQVVRMPEGTVSWVELVIRIAPIGSKKARENDSRWHSSAGGEGNKIQGKIYLDNQYNFNITIGAHGYISEKNAFLEFPVVTESMISYER